MKGQIRKCPLCDPSGISIKRRIVLLRHALLHLNCNHVHIPEHDECGGGWYCGDKKQFIKRHVQTIAFLKSVLEEPKP